MSAVILSVVKADFKDGELSIRTFSNACATAGCIFFLLTGRAFVSRLGIQNDEALFASGIYGPRGAIYSIHLSRVEVPLMLMSYMGTLKGWFYSVLFHFWKPGPASVRLPVLLAGVATVWLTYLLVRRLAGSRAAVVATVLLATDSIFLITTVFDWGPVAVQHLLFISSVVLLLRFDGSRSPRALSAAFFLLGLAVWDKAILVWLLAGLVAAGLAVVPRRILAAVTVRRAALAAACFALGCLPLILYNIDSGMATFRTNARYSASDVAGKANLLRVSMNGEVMFGWLSPEDDQAERPAAPRGAVQTGSLWLSDRFGRPRTSLGFYAFCVAVALFPLVWWKDRPSGRVMLFSLVLMAVTWIQMALTEGAGGSVHHAVLLWPFPQVAIGTALASVSRLAGRRGTTVLAVLTLVLAFGNFRVANEYYAKAVRNGGAQNWTDAIYPLAEYMRHTPAQFVFIVDWGILDSLRLLDRGSLPLRVGSDPVSKPELTPADLDWVRQWVESPQNVFIGHTPPFEFFAGNSAKLEKLGAAFGYRKQMMQVVADRHGRPVYEVFRFAR